jgi:hypothetical protein
MKEGALTYLVDEKEKEMETFQDTTETKDSIIY